MILMINDSAAQRSRAPGGHAFASGLLEEQYLCMYVCVYIYIYIHLKCLCIYIYIYTYIHTYE